MIFGGADGTQTHDLYDANVALYQLSYNPKTGADKKTRTSKALLPLVPETSASTNSAISARRAYIISTLHILQGENSPETILKQKLHRIIYVFVISA